MLTSRQPMFVWWGDELINLYNDAYISILGGKHPKAPGNGTEPLHNFAGFDGDLGNAFLQSFRQVPGAFLRISAIHKGIPAYPDPAWADFYDVALESGWAYIHIHRNGHAVYLVAHKSNPACVDLPSSSFTNHFSARTLSCPTE